MFGDPCTAVDVAVGSPSGEVQVRDGAPFLSLGVSVSFLSFFCMQGLHRLFCMQGLSGPGGRLQVS